MKARWQAARARIASLARALVAAPWAIPVLRVLTLGAGLVLLAAIGVAAAAPRPGPPPPPSPAESQIPAPAPTPTPTPPPATDPPSSTAVPAPESPVVLNLATAEDLQRLPGIGPKKAQAIVALRQRIGHFRQIEDLMKVKGIGRATIKRLRPLVRVDPPARPASPANPPAAPAQEAPSSSASDASGA